MTALSGSAIPAEDPFFLVAVLPPAGQFLLDGPEGRHAATVKRLRIGETLVLTDGVGGWLRATVTEVQKAALGLRCDEPQVSAPNEPRVLIVQALPKGSAAILRLT